MMTFEHPIVGPRTTLTSRFDLEISSSSCKVVLYQEISAGWPWTLSPHPTISFKNPGRVATVPLEKLFLFLLPSLNAFANSAPQRRRRCRLGRW